MFGQTLSFEMRHARSWRVSSLGNDHPAFAVVIGLVPEETECANVAEGSDVWPS